MNKLKNRDIKIIVYSGSLVLAIVAFGLFFTNRSTISKLHYVGRIVLFEEGNDGSLKESGIKIPYDIMGTYPNSSLLLLSPDKNKIVQAVWEDAHIVIYVSLINGKEKKKIAEQKVPEGSGSLDVNSIRWSDDSLYITYAEEGLKCLKDNCVTPKDFSTVRTVQSIAVGSGEQMVTNTNVESNEEMSAQYPELTTYTSEKLGFSFQYPIGYYLTEIDSAVGLSGGESEMWEYNISSRSTQFKDINDWLVAQPKGGATLKGIQPVLRIGNDSLLVENYEVVDYNGDTPIYGKHLDAVAVRGGKLFKIAIRSQLRPQEISWITAEAMSIVASLK